MPSAVSYTINKLEEDLGVELFDRSRRKAELTAIGRLVSNKVGIFSRPRKSGGAGRQAADGWEVVLRICIESVLSSDAIYALIEDFQRIQPKTEIRLSEEVLSGSWDALSDDRCDLVIGAEGAAPAPGLSCTRSAKIAFDFAVAAGHPLTQLPTPIATSAIFDYPTVMVADSSQRLPTRSAGFWMAAAVFTCRVSNIK